MLRKSIIMLILGGFLPCLALPGMAAQDPWAKMSWRLNDEKQALPDAPMIGVQTYLPKAELLNSVPTAEQTFRWKSGMNTYFDWNYHKIIWSGSDAQIMHPDARMGHEISYGTHGSDLAGPVHLTVAFLHGTSNYLVQLNDKRWLIPALKEGDDTCVAAILEKIDEPSITYAQKMKIRDHLVQNFAKMKAGAVLDITIATHPRVN